MHTTEKENTHRPSTPISTRLPAWAKGVREENAATSSALDRMAVGGEMVGSPPHYTDGSHTHQLHEGATHMSELHAAMSAIIGVMQVAKGAIEARDWAKLSEVSAKFNDQIIKTQQAVIDAQSAQSDLVTELGKANNKIRELEAAVAEQARHQLEEIVPGKVALRLNTGMNGEHLTLNSDGGPKYYACQPCFALTGKSVILRLEPAGDWYSAKYVCPSCKTELVLQ